MNESITPFRTESALDPIQNYFQMLGQILLRPKKFFSTVSLTGGLSGPLAFALISHWLGAAFSLIWTLMFSDPVGSFFHQVFNAAQNMQLMDSNYPSLGGWVWNAALVIADLIITLVQIFITSLLVFIGARIFITPGQNGAPNEISFESIVRLIAYARTPMILTALPFMGSFIGYVYVFVLTVIGAKEIYKISTGRAVFITIFPTFAVFLLVFSLFVMFFFAAVLPFIIFLRGA